MSIRIVGAGLYRTGTTSLKAALESLKSAGRLVDLELAGAMEGDPRRVVAPVLEATQPRQQNGDRLLLSHVSDDSTHARSPWVCTR